MKGIVSTSIISKIFPLALPAVVIFNKLVKDSSAIFASSVTYLIPIVALLWGVFDGENITIYHLAGVSVILSGVYLVNKKTPTI